MTDLNISLRNHTRTYLDLVQKLPWVQIETSLYEILSLVTPSLFTISIQYENLIDKVFLVNKNTYKKLPYELNQRIGLCPNSSIKIHLSSTKNISPETAIALTLISDIIKGLVHDITTEEMLFSLEKQAAYFDNCTYRHMVHVSAISECMGKYLNYSKSQIDELTKASKIHDIGKLLLPHSILHKCDTLTDHEYNIIKQHTLIGYWIISLIPKCQKISKIVLSHHERIDGHGYPNSLKSSSIPYNTKIISIADAFDAMVSKRPYRETQKTIDEAKAEIIQCEDSQFDKELVDTFVTIPNNEIRRLITR